MAFDGEIWVITSYSKCAYVIANKPCRCSQSNSGRRETEWEGSRGVIAKDSFLSCEAADVFQRLYLEIQIQMPTAHREGDNENQ